MDNSQIMEIIRKETSAGKSRKEIKSSFMALGLPESFIDKCLQGYYDNPDEKGAEAGVKKVNQARPNQNQRIQNNSEDKSMKSSNSTVISIVVAAVIILAFFAGYVFYPAQPSTAQTDSQQSVQTTQQQQQAQPTDDVRSGAVYLLPDESMAQLKIHPFDIGGGMVTLESDSSDPMIVAFTPFFFEDMEKDMCSNIMDIIGDAAPSSLTKCESEFSVAKKILLSNTWGPTACDELKTGSYFYTACKMAIATQYYTLVRINEAPNPTQASPDTPPEAVIDTKIIVGAQLEYCNILFDSIYIERLLCRDLVSAMVSKNPCAMDFNKPESDRPKIPAERLKTCKEFFSALTRYDSSLCPKAVNKDSPEVRDLEMTLPLCEHKISQAKAFKGGDCSVLKNAREEDICRINKLMMDRSFDAYINKKDLDCSGISDTWKYFCEYTRDNLWKATLSGDIADCTTEDTSCPSTPILIKNINTDIDLVKKYCADRASTRTVQACVPLLNAIESGNREMCVFPYNSIGGYLVAICQSKIGG